MISHITTETVNTSQLDNQSKGKHDHGCWSKLRLNSRRDNVHNQPFTETGIVINRNKMTFYKTAALTCI